MKNILKKISRLPKSISKSLGFKESVPLSSSSASLRRKTGILR